jgi:aminoglycoside phosphotransferase (APT) family kinase protein
MKRGFLMADANMQTIFMENIPSLQGSDQITPINKGYSNDNKFIVMNNNQKFLLRSFDYKNYRNKQLEYEALIKMKEYNVKCSRPLEMGSIQSHGLGYMLLTFIEGADASEDLPNYSTTDQYNIGVEAGKELLKIHQYCAPEPMSPWYDRKLIKHKRYIENYYKCDVRVKHDTRIMSFIDENLKLMQHRPNVFQHDDYHVGNLIVKDSQLSGVIDFNRFDWGDPIHEFLKVGMFSSEVSIPFSVGQIRGYHHNEEPGELFWRLYSLYLAMCIISSVVWILKVKPEEVDIMMDKINRVLDDHDYFELIRPRWYFKD